MEDVSYFFKGIITLFLLFCSSVFLVFAKPMTAYAGTGTAEPKLNVKSKAIVKGKDYTLKVYNLTETQTVVFTTDSPKTATVSEDGVIKAVNIGTATITAAITDSESEETVKLQCKVTIGPPALFILLSRKKADMAIGQRSQMYWLLSPLNTVEQPKFFSSAPEVASVSAGGIITAKSEGTAYVFAQICNGQFDVCKISVTLDEEEYTDEDDNAAAEDIDFAEFLLKLNENFTNGDNTSEGTGAALAQ